MKPIKNIFLTIISALLLMMFSTAYAICPVCTIAVGAGIGLAQWFGVDDMITGIWIGGFIVSLIMWTIEWLYKKKLNFRGMSLVVIFAYYFIVIAPLYYHGIIGHMLNKLWGIDKILLGIFIGSIAFYVMCNWYAYLKRKNQGKAYFSMQKVVMPVVTLLLLSGVFYYLTK